MKKDVSYYFPHDYNARNDKKLIKVKQKLRQSGIGIYWSLVEILYEEKGKISLTDVPSIAMEFREKTSSVECVINDFDLFKNDGVFFWSDSVNRRLEQRFHKSEKAKESASHRWQNADGMRTYSDSNANKGEERKGNKRKGKEKIGEEIKGEEKKGIFPDQNFQIELPEFEIGKAVEFFEQTKKQKATSESVLSLFTVFKIKHFTGAKFYKDNRDIFSHFFESLKYQNIENGTISQSPGKDTKLGTSAARTAALKDWGLKQ